MPEQLSVLYWPCQPSRPLQLLIEHCDDCAHWVHPAAGECRECGGPLQARPVSGHGTVFTYTVNHHPYNPEIPTPYVIAFVELANRADCVLPPISLTANRIR